MLHQNDFGRRSKLRVRAVLEEAASRIAASAARPVYICAPWPFGESNQLTENFCLLVPGHHADKIPGVGGRWVRARAESGARGEEFIE